MDNQPLRLEAALVRDVRILEWCKKRLTHWSSQRSFPPTRTLGEEVQEISVYLIHVYVLRVLTTFAKREFHKERGGSPSRHPVNIQDLELWDSAKSLDTGDYDRPLPETSVYEACGRCEGTGALVCSQCEGSGAVTCSVCRGRGEVKNERLRQCNQCYGKGRRRNARGELQHCWACNGTGKREETYYVRCPECNGKKYVPCNHCKAEGYVACEECGGSGNIAWTWYLRQKECENENTFVFNDEKCPRKLTYPQCQKRGVTRLVSETRAKRFVEDTVFGNFDAPFMGELQRCWKRLKGQYEGRNEIRIRNSKVEFSQYDAFIRYEYMYKGKVYIAWIDRTTGEVFEAQGGGLMEACAAKYAANGARFVWWNPQEALYHYEKACTLVPNNNSYAQALREQYHFGLWLFRISALGVGGWLWSSFLEGYEVDPYVGWYIVSALFVADILFSAKKLFVSLLGGIPVAGIIFFLLPYFYSPQMAASSEIQLYVIYSVLLAVASSLLFAHDLLFRMRGGLLVFPFFGACVAGITAPSAYLDFSTDPQRTLFVFQCLLYIIGGLSIVRFWNRQWIKTCDTLAHRVSFRIARLETHFLKPRLLTLAFWFFIFSGMAYAWNMFAGPGVTLEQRFQASKRLLADEVLHKRGVWNLLSCVEADYAPAMSFYAEALVKGLYRFPKNTPKGYRLAIMAGNKGDAYAWRLQGYCHEFGIAVSQDMSKAYTCYEQAITLGDKGAQTNLNGIAEIAPVWKPAHAGDGESAYALALCYAEGKGIKKDVSLARIWLLKAAGADAVRAQLLVSEWLIRGIGGSKDVNLGLEYCQKAARNGNETALKRLGMYYFKGEIVTQDYAKAVAYFEQLYKLGSGYAAYMLGFCYQMGKGVTYDNEKAYHYFQYAAQNNVIPAFFFLGEYFRNGLVVAMDYTKAHELYLKASSKKWEDPITGKTYEDAKVGVEQTQIPAKFWHLAIDKGDVEAQYQLAMCYKSGDKGLPQDMVAAFKLFKQAAEQGHPEALYHLALCYAKGEGCKQNDIAMRETLYAAAEKGNANAFLSLGDLYQTGCAVGINYTTAYHYFKQAAVANVEGADARMKNIAILAEHWDEAHKGNANAQLKLAICYRDGIQVPIDLQAAKTWFEKSANQSNPEAQYCLAILKRQLKEDPREIVFWLENATKGNHTNAKTLLGEYLYEGNGIPTDSKRALLLWENAAEQKDARAAYLLGKHYYSRSLFLFRKDPNKAKHFLKLAYALKSKEAALLLGKLYEDEGLLDLAKECYSHAAEMTEQPQ